MADVLLSFGIDPSSFSTIKSQLNGAMQNLSPKVKLDVETGSIESAHKAYQRLNNVISSTVKEYERMNSGVNPNKAQYTEPLQGVIERLGVIKSLFKEAFENGTAASQVSALNSLITEMTAKVSEITGAFSVLEGGNYMRSITQGTAEYEQSLARVEEKIRQVTTLQSEINSGTKVVDESTAQRVDETATAFQNLAKNLHGMGLEQYREQFARLSRELADLQSKTSKPIELLGDDPSRLASTMSRVQTMMSKVVGLQDKIRLGKSTASPETIAEVNQLAAALQNLSANMAGMPADEASQKVAQLSASLISVTGRIRATGSMFSDFIGGMGAGIRSYLSYVFSWYQIIFKTVQEVREMINTAVELDTSFTQLQIVTRISDEEMGQFSRTLADTAKNMSGSVKDMAEVATVYARLGYSLEESNALSQYTAMLQNVGDIDSSSASDAITAIVKAYGKGVDDIESLMDKMVTVGNNFPISVSQIAEGMNNAASMMANAGMSFDESVALLTAANTTVQNISKSSTGLRTIIARLRNVKTELDEAGETWNEAKYQELVSALTKGGVDLQDATGALRNPYQVLSELAAKWSSLSSDVQAAITTALAGTRQQDIFASLMNQFGEATKAMDAMADSSGALSDAYGVFEDSMQGHINKLKAAFQELSMEAINRGLVNGVVDFGTKIVELITPIVSGLGQVLSFLGPIGTALTTIAGISIFRNLDSSIEFVHYGCEPIVA